MKKKKFQHLYFYKYADKKARLSVNKMGVSKESDSTQRLKCESCGAVNPPLKKNCWVCSKPLDVSEPPRRTETVFVLRLEVDGKVYRSTDDKLSAGMKQLFADLIANNFAQKPFEDWVKKREFRAEMGKAFVKAELSQIKDAQRLKNTVTVFTAIVVIIILVLLVAIFLP